MADSNGSEVDGLQIREGLDDLTPARIVMLYRRAPLLRAVRSEDEVWTMFENASLVLTAWYRGELVGIARVLTDGVLYSYLCDLAVEPDVQRIGIGRALVDRVMEACAGTELILRDADISSRFYERLGFERVTNAWVWHA